MKIYTYDTIVIGSGAAGFNALVRIKEGKGSVALVCENKVYGTSRNTGSDKQTYYKLGLGGDIPDSVLKMAQDMYGTGCVDGDNALVEAALSTRCFINLVEAGVEFPTNRYGEYIGYKTDHDTACRATSAGPLTSKYMTEALERRAEKLGAEIYSGYLAVEVLCENNCVTGVLCLEVKSGELCAFNSANVILATGGPAGIYADSVYPESQTGSTSLALFSGASLQNFTEWQYGLASTNPRWNVSGTYMQVLPRFVSVDENGVEYEFLADAYTRKYDALTLVFLKGYQWPFDVEKAYLGSSEIDTLVHREIVEKRRRVFLDYRINPFGFNEIDFKRLTREAREYLERAGADFGTPVERLIKMNTAAYELYLSKGVDLKRDMLEISLCAQHNNGGVSVDMWWQTSVSGLFAVGECAGTHGIKRPGGSALNAGQVGSLRASQYILQKGNKPDSRAFEKSLEQALDRHREMLEGFYNSPDNVEMCLEKIRRFMSDYAAAVRDCDRIKQGFEAKAVGGKNPVLLYKYRDALYTSKALLFAIDDYIKQGVGDRGSAKYSDGKREDISYRSKIQEIKMTASGFESLWRDVRPIPQENEAFEKIWKGYRENRNVL